MGRDQDMTCSANPCTIKNYSGPNANSTPSLETPTEGGCSKHQSCQSPDRGRNEAVTLRRV